MSDVSTRPALPRPAALADIYGSKPTIRVFIVDGHLRRRYRKLPELREALANR
jgi:hypothetical protein